MVLKAMAARGGAGQLRRATRRAPLPPPSTPTTGWWPAALEREWEERLRALAAAKADLERRERQQPRMISQQEREPPARTRPQSRCRLGRPPRPRARPKGALRTLIEEVIVRVERDKAAGAPHTALEGRRGSTKSIWLCRAQRPATIRTDEDTIALVGRLAVHYSDSVIAGILNRRAHHGIRSSLHRRTRRQPASPLGYPVL